MRTLLFVIVIVMELAESLNAQTNTDSLFVSAINDSRNGLYNEAILKSESILNIYPDRYDILIFMANVYAWKGDYENALNAIHKAFQFNKSNTELYDSWLNILLWNEKYKELIEISDVAVQNNYTNQYNVVLKKTIAYKNIGEYGNGIKLIDQYYMYLDSSQIKQLYIEMQMHNKSAIMSLFYSIDLFDNENVKPYHLSFVDYALKIKQHTLIPRISYANRFSKYDFQFETDYYHFLRKNSYLYSNLGAGFNKTLFTKYRAGLEYYFPTGKKSEGSAGCSFLNSESSNVLIITGNYNTYINVV
jgi:tetratricopeptide (TPR) repeat protein